MDPLFRAEFVDQTVLHPVGLVVLLGLAITILLVRRRYALVPLVLLAAVIAPAQRITVASLSFDFVRLLVLAGWLRVIARGEYRPFRWHHADTILLAYVTWETVATLLRFPDGSVMVYRLGVMYDWFGIYFLVRCLVQSWEDVPALGWALAAAAMGSISFYLVELATGHNMFAAMGGVPEITVIREGRLRCQGPFPHPIMAGCFWAGAIPLIAALWWQGHRRYVFVVAGVIAAFVIVVCTASSTPVAAVGAVVLGWLVFPWRRYLPYMRWGVVVVLLGLHLVMKAPVWHLIGRLTLVGGSTSWHRFSLIDAAITHVDEWAVIGTGSLVHWGPGLHDVTCQYIAAAINGGLLGLTLFVAMHVVAFRQVGITCRASEHAPALRNMAWAMGVSLAAHMFSFIGVSYFGQIMVLWVGLIAMIVSAGQATRQSQAVARIAVRGQG